MNKKLCTSILMFLLCFSNTSFCQSTPDEYVKKFFDEYQKFGSGKAIDNLYAGNKWMMKAQDAITQLKTQLDALNKDFVGDYHGYEMISKKTVAQSFVVFTYMVKYDRQPIRFTFQFYKPEDKWLAYAFLFDGELGDEMQEANKLYHLNLDK